MVIFIELRLSPVVNKNIDEWATTAIHEIPPDGHYLPREEPEHQK